jgi:hypothetical protein
LVVVMVDVTVNVLVNVMGPDPCAVLASSAAVPHAARDAGQDLGQDLGQVVNIDDEFFALIYSDEELLRDEFDALMAASWSGPPPSAAYGRGAERPLDRPRPGLSRTEGGRRDRVCIRVRDSRVRTRSPPDTTGSGPSRDRRRKEGSPDPLKRR